MELKKEIIIYPSILKLLGLFIGASIFVLMGTFLIIAGFNIDIGIDISIEEGYSQLLIGIIGVICNSFFGLCWIYIAIRLFVRKPLVIISEDGFTDNASAISVGFLKWSEIKSFKVYNYMGQKFLGIEPVDVEATLQKVSKLKRTLLNANKSLGTAIINIPQNACSMPLEKIHDKMVEFNNKTNKGYCL
ncbi:STM3941 family protein [Acetivibrio cellulolyticus]|uniref:STM3941 family protein n=1 Tax=Acetivibrio cellulolyticus TaxID=35830 RepID=UPI0001E2C1F0|nr:STM3941 family protein [Acetivibrio cellulolyticus]